VPPDCRVQITLEFYDTALRLLELLDEAKSVLTAPSARRARREHR
jgi:hypothetical protein